MENASKALIIAGSILVAILLIAMGVRIVVSTNGTTDNVDTTMDATAIATFNNKFIGYIGTNKSRGQVMSLLNAIIASNSTDSAHPVQVNGTTDLRTKMNNLGNGPFTISISSTGGYTNGLISNISITYKVSGTDTAI